MLLYVMSSEKNETRTRILKTTWELLEASAGKEVRMIDIARAAGISRQAVYLHFENRTDLLIATTRYIDEVKGIDDRLASSRTAANGIDRLIAFIDAWGNYIPEIYGVARVLIAARDHDPDAAIAWHDRMQAVRGGCAAAIDALKKDDALSAKLSDRTATDILWTQLSIGNWELLVQQCGWSQEQYVNHLKKQANLLLIARS